MNDEPKVLSMFTDEFVAYRNNVHAGTSNEVNNLDNCECFTCDCYCDSCKCDNCMN